MALYTGNNYAAIKMMMEKNMKHGNVLDKVSEKYWLQMVYRI